ncbi:MAG TPA: serine/threonine-protein kinase [Kofleriaceae bacterium]|nr:serine/threonine-protein kinase [Kofleriaceae bacterium]
MLHAVVDGATIPAAGRLGDPVRHIGRFQLLRRLGAGGMGVVYEALDPKRNVRVAVKTLRNVDAHLLYRLKREFRGLRDLNHRNLVALDELFEEHGSWFFTMELLDGEELYGYLGHVTEDHSHGAAIAVASSTNGEPATLDQPLPGRGNDRPPLDFDRVRDVLAQVTEGLIAIHDAGKVHRDIKPSNIIVTREGRAVILDFGLATEHSGTACSGEGEIVGTFVYMAPEQADGHAVGPAADWYSVGVILYELLTGQRLFVGSLAAVLVAKQLSAPRDPKQLNPSCPDDLAELCMRLLQVDPEQRPDGSEVLARLDSGRRRSSDPAIALSAPPRKRVFVGRDRELRKLHQALEDLHGGATITVFVHGESGIGKSTLIQHFIGAVEADDSAVVLTGQCREHEVIPFKAMDGIIDALARYVSRLPEVAAARLVPKHAALLPSVFPVLDRIPAVASAPRSLHVISDPFQRRQRVFAALREMLCRLTEQRRLICVIDDMQWADSDSLHLLHELLRPPEQPELLLLASIRSDGDQLALPQLPGEVRCVDVQPLSLQESMTLAAVLLDRTAPGQDIQTARLVDDTGGHPLFIGELVRYAAATSSGADPRSQRRGVHADGQCGVGGGRRAVLPASEPAQDG